jgi:PDZ domain-containing protein
MIILVMVILVALSFYRLPYYIQKPGSAIKLDPIVHVSGGYHEPGEFMLTTVRMGQANIYDYLLAKVKKFEDLVPVKEIRSPEESDEEYDVRQLYLMDDSKNNAIELAYKKANKEVNYQYNGIYVLSTFKGMPSYNLLKPGDRIIKIDNHTFSSSKGFITYIQSKKAGDKVTIDYKRSSKLNHAKMILKPFKEGNMAVGLGIGLVDDKTIKTDPTVKLDTDQIGGPSAGFMFSLEIYDQLTKGDLPKGHLIAGTGTISPSGEVGRIGGIQYKVVAADRAGADIFFAPDDTIPKEALKKDPALKTNYQEAVKAGKEIQTKMKIIPIHTFNDAIDYLDQLK